MSEKEFLKRIIYILSLTGINSKKQVKKKGRKTS